MSQNISKFSPSETDPWSWIQPCMRDESSPSQTPFLSQQLSETRSATAILRCWNCSQRTWFSCYWNVFLFDNLKTAPSPKRLQDMGSNSRHGPMLRWTTRNLLLLLPCHASRWCLIPGWCLKFAGFPSSLKLTVMEAEQTVISRSTKT